MFKRSIFLLAAVAALTLAGCGSGGDNKSAGGGDKAATGPAPGAKLSGNVEVAAFKGGYGIDFYEQAAKEFQEKNPDLKITVSGDPRIWEKLMPRFASGDVPDLVFPGWGFDHFTAATDGELMPLDDALAGKPYEGEGTWKDTFESKLLALGQQDGKQYVLPYYFNVMGWWYNPDVFAKNGWKVPKTYDELLKLCDAIKAKGMAPITFQGKYPYYMEEGMLLPWAYSVGGRDAVNAAQNLEPGAWKSPAMLKAAQMIQELNDKGDFEKGAVALSHTESQSDFVQGKVAMIPCGTWLYSEMEKTMPAGTKMEFMLPPVVSGGVGDPSNVMIGIEPWMIPDKAKNKDGAIALFKYMTSLTKAKQFVEQKGTLMAIKGSDQAKLPDVLKTPAQVFKDSKDVWCDQVRNWYKDFQKELENSITAMLNHEVTPEQFCDRVEAAAEKTRGDNSIPKHKVAG